MTSRTSSWRRFALLTTGLGLAVCALPQSGCGGAGDELLSLASEAQALGTTDYGDVWQPYWEHEHAVYFRNNKLTTYKITGISRSASSSGCSSSDFTYTNGSTPTLDAARVVEVLNIDDSACRNTSNVWKFVLTKDGCTDSHSIYVRGDGSVSSNGSSWYSSSTNQSLSYCGSTITVNLQGRDNFYATGAYITIGSGKYGDLAPTRDSSDQNKLTVTSFNTYLGTESKPEKCDRAEAMKSVLASLNTDVLVLEEMNLRSSGCTDGLELAAYLWTGDDTETGDDTLEYDSYASSDSGSGVSPAKSGVFPYISQFASGLATDGDEDRTGGVVILSKYPVTMLENYSFPNGSGTNDHRRTSEQKGFIVAKITKGTQDYYVLATHPDADSTYRTRQIGDIEDYLKSTTDIPSGARVILAGDLNTDGLAGELSGIGVNVGYSSGSYANQINTAYYSKSRDSTIDFYKCCQGNENIDWVQPMTAVKSGYTFTQPTSFSWYVHPMRDVTFKFAELSDHFAVTGSFSY